MLSLRQSMKHNPIVSLTSASFVDECTSEFIPRRKEFTITNGLQFDSVNVGRVSPVSTKSSYNIDFGLFRSLPNFKSIAIVYEFMLLPGFFASASNTTRFHLSQNETIMLAFTVGQNDGNFVVYADNPFAVVGFEGVGQMQANRRYLSGFTITRENDNTLNYTTGAVFGNPDTHYNRSKANQSFTSSASTNRNRELSLNDRINILIDITGDKIIMKKLYIFMNN